METYGIERGARFRVDGNCRVTNLTGGSTVDGYLALLQSDDGGLFCAVRVLGPQPSLDVDARVLIEGNTEASPSQKVRADGFVVASNFRRFRDQTGFTDLWISVNHARLAYSLLADEDVFADSVQVNEGRVRLYNCFLPLKSLKLGEMSIHLPPSKSIGDQHASYKQAGGIFETHDAAFVTPGFTVPELHSRLNDACLTLSLAGLTYVFWPEATAVEGGQPVMQYLRRPITRRKVRDAFGIMEGVDAQEIADRLTSLDPNELRLARRYVHQLIDATDETVFLETRALSAVVLLERILNDRVTRTIEGPSKSSLDKLRSKLVNDARNAQPELPKSVITNIREGLARMGEKSFRTALTEFLADHDFLVPDFRQSTVSAVGRIRNLLVHEGRFDEAPNWRIHEQYLLVHWVAAACCLRAIGVKSGFGVVPAHISTSVESGRGDDHG